MHTHHTPNGPSELLATNPQEQGPGPSQQALLPPPTLTVVNHPIIAATVTPTPQRVVNDAVVRQEGIDPVLDLIGITKDQLEAGVGKTLAGILLDRAPGLTFADCSYLRSPGFNPSATPHSPTTVHHYNMTAVPSDMTDATFHGIPTTITGYHVRIVGLEETEPIANEIVRECEAKGMPVARSRFLKSRNGDTVNEVLLGFRQDSQTVSSLMILLHPQILDPRTCRGTAGVLTCHAITVPHFDLDHSVQDMKAAFGVRVADTTGVEEGVLIAQLLGKERSNREQLGDRHPIQYLSMVKSAMTRHESGANTRISHPEWRVIFITMLDALSLENFMKWGPVYLEEIGISNATLESASQPRPYIVFGTREGEITPPACYIELLTPEADDEDKLYLDVQLTNIAEEIVLNIGQLTPYPPTEETGGQPSTTIWANRLIQVVDWSATPTARRRVHIRFTLASNIDYEKFLISDYDLRAPALALRTGRALRWDVGKLSKIIKANNRVFVARTSGRGRELWREKQTVQPAEGVVSVWNAPQTGAATLRAENEATRRHDILLRSITTLSHHSAQEAENNRRSLSQIRDTGLAQSSSLATVHGAVVEGNRQTHGMQLQHTETLRRQEGVLSRLAVASSALSEVMAMQQQSSAPPPGFPSNGGHFLGSQAHAGPSVHQVSNA